MNIIQAIETSGPGGAERIFISLCVELRARGHNVLPVLLKTGWLTTRLEEQGLNCRVLKLTRAMDRLFLKRFRELAADFKADAVHSHEFAFGLYGALLARTSSVQHVATAHGKNYAGNLKRRVLGGTAISRSGSTSLVAVSGDLRKYLSRQYFLTEKNIEVVPNGIPIGKSGSIRPQRSPGSTLKLLAIGNLYPVKNQFLMVEAVARLVQAGLDVSLQILGRGGEEARLRARIGSLGLNDVVLLPGFVENVEPFLKESHALVSSSISEGMPVSFLEAMAAGLPVISTQVGGVSEIIQDGNNGLLYPSGDVEALVRCIREIYQNEARRMELGKQGEILVKKQYSVTSMVGAYEQLYAR